MRWNAVRLMGVVWGCLAMVASAGAELPTPTGGMLRPPSVPLVVHDPYFSIWSPADALNQATTVHWTGKPHALTSLIRVDGKTYRLMGSEPADLPALAQQSVAVWPTRTIYTFAGEGVRVSLTFLTPALPGELDVLARPATYLIWEAAATDGRTHEAALYFDASPEIAVNTPDQKVQYAQPALGALPALSVGTQDQPILGKRGDNLRIDWGYMYVTAPPAEGSQATIADAPTARAAFATGQPLPKATAPGSVAAETGPHLVWAWKLGMLNAQPAERWLIVAYDDLFGIEYFKQPLRPYWRRNGAGPGEMLAAAVAEYAGLRRRCAAFDAQLDALLKKAGGAEYALLGALAYRQCLAANKLVADPAGMPLLFPKENFSNGCIATVDVIYPQAPQMLLTSIPLTKALLRPVMDYAASPRWTFPYAPHDLGKYPLANGQVYGGGEKSEARQMPVEETANLLILLAALAQMEGHADFAHEYWPLLTRWADYLVSKGLDPENQLCTDDFAGHLAHNVNLSAKAIVGLGAYAQLCAMTGDKSRAEKFRTTAQSYVQQWITMADDGDHTRLAFDTPGTWSQKYNLVWDRVLGLGLFPDAVLDREIQFYKKIQNRYGLPLDNRKAYTKLDWITWTASLATRPEDFHTLVHPIIEFLNATPDRVPMTDWYQTIEPKKQGFQARSVVGGVFIKTLLDRAEWKQWVQQGGTVAGRWAPVAMPGPLVSVVPAGDEQPVVWRYTLQQPAEDWMQPAFDAAAWKEGPAGFGAPKTPKAVVRTTWKTADIWLRRTFTLDRVPAKPRLWLYHDEDVEVYINGVLAAQLPGFVASYDDYVIAPAALAALKPGANVLAVHCRQTTGGQCIDVGLVAEGPLPGAPK